MAKPRVIIADTDKNYIFPLQQKFVEDFFEKIDLEIITDAAYFKEFFSLPQRIDVLIVSEDLYEESLQRHNISNIFLMTEQYEESQTDTVSLNLIFKYTSIKEIFNEIIGKSFEVLNVSSKIKKETQVIVVYSAAGGVGKTTVSMGVAASLTKHYKRVLYINAAYLQTFAHMLNNPSPVSSSDVYLKLNNAKEGVYSDIKYIIRSELFSYLPPFKASLMSLGIDYSVFEKIILGAKKSGDYDYIVVDTDITFNEAKAKLLNCADKVVVVTDQSYSSVCSTNTLVSNINGINNEKYIFICNDFIKNRYNALVDQKIHLNFSVSEYIHHIDEYEKLDFELLSNESSVQRTVFLIL